MGIESAPPKHLLTQQKNRPWRPNQSGRFSERKLGIIITRQDLLSALVGSFDSHDWEVREKTTGEYYKAYSPDGGHVIEITRDRSGRVLVDAESVIGNERIIAVTKIVESADAGGDVVMRLPGGEKTVTIGSALVRDESGHRRELVVTWGNEVKLRRVDWWKQDWIPRNALTLLAGREGLGKSTIAASWCAEETRRGNSVLYLHSEDSRSMTVAPRLLAAGADMERVAFVDVRTESSDSSAIVLPKDTDRLRHLIDDHSITLVVLDAATSSMDAQLSGKDDRQVRQFLEPLSRLADDCGIVVLGIVHFGKRESDDSGKLILGSIAWSQVARSVLSVAQDADSGELIVTNTKGNLATRTYSEACRITSGQITLEGGDVTDVGVVKWLGETTQDARELLSGTTSETSSEIDEWLIGLLRPEPVKANDVYSAADAAGFSKDQAKKAKKRLGVQAVKIGKPWFWKLPEEGSDTPDQGSTPTQGSDLGAHAKFPAPLLPSSKSTGQGVGEGSVTSPLASRRPVKGVREQGSGRDALPLPSRSCRMCGEPMSHGSDIEAGIHASCLENARGAA